MALIKAGRVEPDPWTAFGPEAGATDHVVLTLAEWREHGARLRAANGALGLRLGGADEAEEIADHLGRLALVALEFAKFTDGRAYSTGRILRERYDYKGELRAVGDVLRDQLPFMARCGFDAFEVPDGDVEACLAALGRSRLVYQRAADGAPPLWAVRARHAAAQGDRS